MQLHLPATASVEDAVKRPDRAGARPNRSVSRRLARAAAVCAGFGAALVLVAAAQAHSRTNPSLSVSFVPDGSVSVTTSDGMVVGTSSGAPTVIPAGYYTLLFSGIKGCGAVPYFHLS